MRRRLIIALAALAGVGCGDIPQAKQAEPGLAEKFAVGKDIPYGTLITRDDKGRRYFICSVTEGMVGRRLKVPDGVAFPTRCLEEPSPVQDLGGGRYTITSWVEIAGVRTEYSGDAVIQEVGGIPLTLRITRLDLGGAQ